MPFKKNLKVAHMLQRVLAKKKQELSDMPRASPSDKAIAKQKQNRRFAISAIQRAIEQILAVDFEIQAGEDALIIPGVGKGTAARIDEFFETGTLEELKGFVPRKTSDLEKVFGVGPALSKKYADMGILTVGELRQAITSGYLKVTDQIVEGILHYRDLLSRIPRSEMDFYNDIFKRLQRSGKLGPYTRFDLLGSYRRGSPDCGDLDVLVTSKENPKTLLSEFLAELKRRKMLVAYLSEGATKFAGIIKHPKIGIGRRIDMRYVPIRSYPFALLYYTGSASFNVKMRNIFLSRGFSLSEYGLKNKKEANPMVKNIRTETDIFNLIGYQYIKPEDRDADAFNKNSKK